MYTHAHADTYTCTERPFSTTILYPPSPFLSHTLSSSLMPLPSLSHPISHCPSSLSLSLIHTFLSFFLPPSLYFSHTFPLFLFHFISFSFPPPSSLSSSLTPTPTHSLHLSHSPRSFNWSTISLIKLLLSKLWCSSSPSPSPSLSSWSSYLSPSLLFGLNRLNSSSLGRMFSVSMYVSTDTSLYRYPSLFIVIIVICVSVSVNIVMIVIFVDCWLLLELLLWFVLVLLSS